MSQRGATRPEMIRSSEITGGFELRATCRARAPFDRNRVVGAPRHHSSERGKIRLSSPYASLETYATEYYEQHYRQADTAGRDVRRARRVLGRPNVHEERPRRVAPTPPRRRAPSRAEAQSGGEFSGGRGLARERPVPGAVMGHQRQSAPIRTPTDHPIPITV